MGTRYLGFRLKHEFDKKSGRLAKRFPVSPKSVQGPALEEGKRILDHWVWGALDRNEIPILKIPELELKAKSVLDGTILLFNSIPYRFKSEEDWIIHPETGFRYDNRKHWTTIPDMSTEAGDIKYVWEKSRFSYFHVILRYDQHYKLDHSEWIFSEMESWIRINPINCGPNYRCSQEISLRVLNWLGALAFYKESSNLTEERWSLFFHHMYWQINHVWENIQFSRIAVRNNHAITETLALYIFGSLFQNVADASKWKAQGKAWFEQEIEYQIYPDGSYLQFSMNYQRVVVQLLTLAIRFADEQMDPFKELVYRRADKTLRFLYAFQDPVSGQLPNYGANDGALFFQFSDLPFRNYNSQLNALQVALTGSGSLDPFVSEEASWFGYPRIPFLPDFTSFPEKLQVFGAGGFAGIKEDDTLTFFRSGKHKDRPSQADNHHLDLWFNGVNILRDAGSYKYNAGEEDIHYFFGTRSHNTAQVNNLDQMVKGPRFVWLNWSQSISLTAREEEKGWMLTGEIEAFRQIRKGIRHKRTIWKERGKAFWKVEDVFYGLVDEEIEVLWHPHPDFISHFNLIVLDENNSKIEAEQVMGWYSGLYGQKEQAPFYIFRSHGKSISSSISIK